MLLAWFNNGLLPHNTFARDLLNFAIAISNNPLATQELGTLQTTVGDSDSVGEHVAVAARVRLFGKKLGFYAYVKVIIIT